jgi:hypothetical protein
MNIDDKVIYCERHYKWLKDAGRWPSIHLPREAMVGRVTDVQGKMVTVLWPEKPALIIAMQEQRHHLLPTRIHFADNLEPLRP